MLMARPWTRWLPALPLLIAASGCFDARERPTVPVFGAMAITSDPTGADIILDDQSTGAITPDTLAGVAAGRHSVRLSLDAGELERFSFADTLTVPENGLASLDAALEGGCNRDCNFIVDNSRIHCRFTGNGDTCASAFFFGSPALRWPGPTGDYAAAGRLILAGILGDDAEALAGDTISTLLFQTAWIGRRPVSQTQSGRIQTTELEYWATALFPTASIQGLSVRQTIVTVDSARVRDVLFIQFEIENVSASERYRRLHPSVPVGGFTFTQLYLGYALDADIGASGDDLGSVDADLGLVFMYDADFHDDQLGERASRPALVGLAVLEPPQGSSERTLTFWRGEDDWDDGTMHDFAWRLLAGRLAGSDPIPDHSSPEIGFHPVNSPDDYRMTIGHGPVQLSPGASVTMTIAVILAEPAAGSFTPGEGVGPGNPLSANRRILTIAADLRALAADLPLLWDRYALP